MRWLDTLERHLGAWTIPQFPLFIVAANGAIYILSLANPAFRQTLLLNPQAVWAGDVWRVFTFLFVPPGLSPLFLVFWLLLLYQYAQALEHAWGEFRFFMFYFLGALITVIAALGVSHQTMGNAVLNLSIFLAFATLFPESELLLFFVFPVKVKYLAWLVGAGLTYALLQGSAGTRVAIGASLFNYALFFGPSIAEKLSWHWRIWKTRRR